ncbi:MAG TPA: hypothetical protein VMU53_06190 [Candidatus Sulfotelmatobacter sp.]|nr:hypothetical protein [Candidatus Sulfotelmatobacter sp.]
MDKDNSPQQQAMEAYFLDANRSRGGTRQGFSVHFSPQPWTNLSDYMTPVILTAAKDLKRSTLRLPRPPSKKLHGEILRPQTALAQDDNF